MESDSVDRDEHARPASWRDKVPSVYQLKPAFQACLRPVVRHLATAGVTANQVTILALLLSLSAGACIAIWPQTHWPLLCVPVVLFVRMALNAIDGMLAREHDMQTPLGALLNELGDVVSDAALYLPLALIPGLSPVLIVFIVFLAVLSEMAGVVAVQIDASRRYDGPMGKSDRAVVFGALSLWLGLGFAVGPVVDAVLLFVAGLLGITTFNRCKQALREVQ